MKNVLIIFFLFLSYNVVAQTRPTGVPTQFSTGWFRWGFAQSDSGLIIGRRDTTFLPRFTGTVVMRPQDRKFYYYDSTDLRWYPLAGTFDTTSLSNRINLKLNISDTASMLLPYLRKVDTVNRWVQDVYVRNDSLFKFKNGAETFIDTLGNGGGGGSGTVTSVGLSLPSAFNVTPSTITTSGTFAVTGAGTTAQYIRGNGTLATTDTGMIPSFHLKVRSLFSGTSPITFNQTTGIIGINNANTSGTKGAATFSAAFQDNGSGTIDLLDLGAAGSCTGCLLNIDAKGRITAYSDGPGGATNNANIGAGFRWLNGITQELRTVANSPTITWDSVSTANTLTPKVDTSIIATQFDISQLSVTADNGLTKTGSNIQLGGALTQSTTISTTASYFLNVTGANVGQSLKGTNTSTGTGVMGQSTSGTGVYGLSSSLNGVLGVSITGTGVVGESSSGEAINANIIPSSTNTLDPVVRIQRFSTGTAANGIGGSLEWYTQSTGGSTQRSNRIGSSWSNATTGSRTSILEFYGVNSATEARKAALAGTGQWTWDGYPALTAQVDTTTYKPVAMDGSGNVVKMAGWSGAGGGGATLTWNGSLLNGNIDTATTMQLGYAQAGFQQLQQDTPTDTTWSATGAFLFPFRGSDTAVYNPRMWRLWKTRTHRYDLTVPYPNTIFTVAEFGEEAVGKPYLQFGDIEQNWYDNYECHFLKMKLIGSGTAKRIGSATMNRTTGVGTITWRMGQQIFSDLDDVQMLALNQGNSTLRASNTLNPAVNLDLQSTDGTNGGLRISIPTLGQTLYNWHPVSGAFHVNVWDLPYQLIMGTSRTVNSGDAEYDIRFASRLRNNRFLTYKNANSFLMVMQVDSDSLNGVTIGGDHFMQTGSFSLMAKSLRNKNQKQFAIAIASNAADTFYYKVPFATDTLGRIAVNIPDPNNSVKDGLLGLTETEDFRVYGKSIVVDNTAGFNRLLTLKNTDAGSFSGPELRLFNNVGTGTGNGLSIGLYSNNTTAPYTNAAVIQNKEDGPIVFYGAAERGRFNDGGELMVGSTTDLGTSKLQVTGTIQMQDGNQASGKVLTSDANGVGTWQSISGATTIYNGDGTLAADRNIASGGFTLRLTGANNSDTLMSIINTGTSSIALFANGTLFGIDAQSSNLGIRAFGSVTGLTAEGGTGEGAIIKSDAVRGATIQSVPVTTNTVQEVLRIERGVNGSPGANGIGGSINFYNKRTDNASDVGNTIVSKFTDAVAATLTSQLYITGVNSGTPATILTLDGDGSLTTTGKRALAVTTSSAGTLTLGNSEAYIFNGTTTTWTLAPVSGTTGRIYYIKNIGSGSITLNADSGNNEIYSSSAVNTVTVTAGSAIILISNNTFWTVN